MSRRLCLNKLKVQGLFALGEDALLLTVLAVGQEVIQLNGGGLLARPLKGLPQALHDLGLAGCGRPGNGQQGGAAAFAISFCTLSMKSSSTSALASLKAL